MSLEFQNNLTRREVSRYTTVLARVCTFVCESATPFYLYTIVGDSNLVDTVDLEILANNCGTHLTSEKKKEIAALVQEVIVSD